MEDERGRLVQSLNTEGVQSGLMEVVEVEEQNREQHQHGADQGVEEELDGGVKFPRAAPDADQQVHGDQHGFPENEEQEEIQRHEDTQHASLKDQKPNVVLLHPGLDRGPRGEDRNPPQKRGQHDQQERNTVDAEDVTRANRRDPVVGRALHELEAGFEALRPEPRHQWDGNQQPGQRKNVCDPADGVFLLLRHKNKQKSAGQRREKNDRENVIMHKSSRRSSVFSNSFATALRNRKRILPARSPSPGHTTAPGPTPASARDTTTSGTRLLDR